MAMALGLRPLPGPRAKPGLRPRHKPNRQVNGHKLGAMAQDIRYPGVRVGEACGPGVACLVRVGGRKIFAYHYHYHYHYHYGIKPASQPASLGFRPLPSLRPGPCHGLGLEAIAQASGQAGGWQRLTLK